MSKDDPIRIIPHSPEGIPDTGSFEVRFADGRDSVYFYWDENAGRRSISMSTKMTRKQALEKAKTFARRMRG
ncbi:hypothetical protein [Bradyrhizobium sp. Leo121]|uniref:hypothetical protein n=1 Tax=Bradyrhizobium sp. Leo121 TaxID=1571195 RepID=UPI001028A175|nr:hypothetical protein [Bradyrhizobium sp. Leo121]RZN21953.1 hypothetical protein CWO90_32580 [Bradyrhizobium sp. Leo121]